MTQSEGLYGLNTATVYAGEQVTFDKQSFLERYYSTRVEINPDLEINVERDHQELIHLNQQHRQVALSREEARRVAEVLQEWLGGEK